MSDISAVNPFTPTEKPASPAPIDNELGADTFLQLLVAQLKYQDPTAPSDGTEFLAQTAQFTMVEKLTQLAEQSEAAAAVNRNLGAASMVGRSITWLRSDGTSAAGVVSSARLGSEGPVLMVGDEQVPFELVSSVVATTPATTSSKTSSATQPTTSDAVTPTV